MSALFSSALKHAVMFFRVWNIHQCMISNRIRIKMRQRNYIRAKIAMRSAPVSYGSYLLSRQCHNRALQTRFGYGNGKIVLYQWQMWMHEASSLSIQNT